MRVVLEDTAFQDRWISELMVILWLGVQGRHRVEVRDPGGGRYTRWVEGLGGATRDEWHAMLDLSASMEAREPAYHAVVLEERTDTAWSRPPPRLPVAAAVRFLLRPYRVLLENNRNDRAFLRCVVSRSVREELDRREEGGALEYEHGGGGDQLPRVEGLKSSRGDALCYSVMFDGDGLRPGARSGTADTLVSACEARSIHHHVLLRRMIENYLPAASLQRWAKHQTSDMQRRVEALGRLNPGQREHYNFEDGFDGDQRRRDRDAVGDLYEAIPSGLRDRLADGFGRKIKSIYASGEVRPEDFDAGRAERGVPEVRRFVEEVLERSR